jgi:LmbE family N-acetylglucosaminyl deacetylase
VVLLDKPFTLIVLALTLSFGSCSTKTQISEGPKILIVVAHPDDDISFAGTVYKTTHHLKGAVDIFMITNGEGGYKYSTLAESYYGIELTEEAIGRKHLPAIRKKELEAAGKIMGLRNYYYMDQKDHRYTLDPKEVLNGHWDINHIKQKLKALLINRHYDYIFTLMPTEGTHGHHKMATILALETVKELLDENKSAPLIFSSRSINKGEPVATTFTELKGYPITKLNNTSPAFTFDRTQKFSYKNRLDYKIIANWAIAEHKSQGTMQLLMNRGDIEVYWSYAINPKLNKRKLNEFENKLKEPQFESKTYK